MTSRGFEQLAVALDADVRGWSRTGLTFTATCPACRNGRVLAWSRRPSRRGSGFYCADCGRRGDLRWLDLLSRRARR